MIFNRKDKTNMSTQNSHVLYCKTGESSLFTLKISKPAISRMPMNEAPSRLVRSKHLLMRWTIHLNILSYKAFAKAAHENSA